MVIYRRHRSQLLAVALMLTVATVGYLCQPLLRAQTSPPPNCPSTTLLTQPVSGSSLAGTTILEVTNNTSGMQVVGVQFIVDGNPVASSTAPAETNKWRASFNTTTLPNGPHNMYGRVFINTTSNSCSTAAINFGIQNGGTPTSSQSLEVTTNVPSWRGPTNVQFGFVTHVDLISNGVKQDITQQASYQWGTTLGSLQPSGNSAAFNSGPQTGTGQVKVRVTYGSLVKDVVIGLQVDASTSTSTYPQPTTADGEPAPTGTTSTTTTTTQTQGETQQVSIYQQGDSELASCLTQILGADRYRALTQDQKRLTYEELKRAEQCFARRNFIVPSNLAPVAPTAIKSLPVRDNLATIEIIRPSLSTLTKPGLTLSGKTLPGKTITIYVFSEPLVLTTQADNEGRWSYTLEDPLQPGNHEAYMTVEGDNSEPVRSSAFAFTIASAARTAENPLGLSLDIKKSGTNFYYVMYVISACLLVAFAIGMTIYFANYHKMVVRKQQALGNADDNNVPR